MGIEQLVVGLRQPVIGHLADGHLQQPAEEEALHRPRQPAHDRRCRFVDRLAAEELGQDVGATPHRDEGLRGDPRGLDGDVDRGVADPEHQHPLADQHLGLAVVVGVELFPLELLGAGEGRLGPARVPVVPIGDENGPVAGGLPVAVGVLDGHLPVVAGRLDRDHLGAEADLLGQAEALGVVVEVLGDVLMAGVVRVVLRHRECLVGHELAGAVDVQGAVSGGLAVVVFVAPVAADHRPLLEAVVGNPPGAEDLASGEARCCRRR